MLCRHRTPEEQDPLRKTVLELLCPKRIPAIKNKARAQHQNSQRQEQSGLSLLQVQKGRPKGTRANACRGKKMQARKH